MTMNILKITVAVAIAALIGCKSGDIKDIKKDSTAAALQKIIPGKPIKLDSSKRYIYLTWDDSPQPPGSNICKKVFTDQGIKATFFAVGMHNFDFRRRSFVDSIRNSYPQFLLANHSYTHGFNNNYKKFYTLPDSAVQDFLRAETEMKIPVKIIRLPGNNSWAVDGELKGPKSTSAVYKKLDSMGYNVIGWDIEWGFVKGSVPKHGAEQLVNEINSKFDNGLTVAPNAIVVLAHDRMFAKAQYTDSLIRFITLLKQDPRNVFETIDHYPLIKKTK